MVAALGDLQATIVITARKVAETEKRNKQIAEVFTKLGERESALQKEIAEAEAAGINLKPEPVHSAPEHPPPNAELVSSMKRLENSLARKRVMVHTLENELKSAQETLSACNLKLQRLSSDLDTKAGEVQNMSEIMDQQITHRRIRSNPVRKVFVTDR
jgi:chromosome segregation ATPase